MTKKDLELFKDLVMLFYYHDRDYRATPSHCLNLKEKIEKMIENGEYEAEPEWEHNGEERGRR